jgi:hypothetical protein
MNTADVLEQLSTAVHRDAARGRRRRLLGTAAATVAIFVVAGVGVAGTYGDWWTGAEPAGHERQVDVVAKENGSVGIDLDLTRKATVARTEDAALVAVATKSGGYCLSLFVEGKQFGSSCTTVADSEYRTRAGDGHWIAYGRILDEGAAALDLSAVGLPGDVPLRRGGFFLFDIPQAQWAAVNERHGDVAVLDASGSALRRACVWTGVAPGSPVAGAGSLGDPGQCDVPPPIDPTPDRSQAHPLVVDGDIALWQAPSVDGKGVCWFTGKADSPAPVVGLGAGGCRSNAQPAPGATHDVLSTMVGGGIASGVLRPGAGIAAVTIRGDGWTADAAVANDAFIARLPGDRAVEVVGYDAAGKEIASQKLQR